VEDREREDEAWPPGEFLQDEHEADTKRFVEAARVLARRRAEAVAAQAED
jgi:hypothetical protein